MVSQKDFTDYVDNLLKPECYVDYCPNGLQVAGVQTIHCLITGVSICEDLINAAVQEKAQAIMVHHGLLWHKEDPCIVGMKQKRLKALLVNHMNLYAYHLPLDGHSILGNNVELGRRLNIRDIRPLAIQPYNPPLLYQGEWHGSIEEAGKAVESLLQRSPLIIKGGDHPIRKLAWCTGAAQDGIEAAAAAGMDAYLSGEVSERTFYIAKERGIHYIAAGHHSTEKYGIQALGEHLAERFNLVHLFVDTHNPV